MLLAETLSVTVCIIGDSSSRIITTITVIIIVVVVIVFVVVIDNQVGWVGGHVARIKTRNAYKILFGRKLKGRDHLVDLGVVRRIILKCI